MGEHSSHFPRGRNTAPTFLTEGTQLPLSSQWGHSLHFPHKGTQLSLSFGGDTAPTFPQWGNTAPTFLTGEHSSHFPHRGDTAPTFPQQGNTAPTFLRGADTAPTFLRWWGETQLHLQDLNYRVLTIGGILESQSPRLFWKAGSKYSLHFYRI